jgi:hypothetical protein
VADSTHQIVKIDDDKRLVFGWASIIKDADGRVLIDRQDDFIDSEDELEKSAYHYVLNSRDGGEMHVRKGVSTVVESVVFTKEKQEALGIPEGTMPVGWWVGFRVDDDDVWTAVKKGDYIGFSVHGTGQRSQAILKDGEYTDIEKAACPVATRDVEVNLRNRKKAIDKAGYGPLNPAEPDPEFWAAKADQWDVSPAQAKRQKCGNCAAFVQTSSMLKCIEAGLGEGDPAGAWDTVQAGDLGYCEAFDFKCAAARTCDAWITGGPVTDASEADKVEKDVAKACSCGCGGRVVKPDAEEDVLKVSADLLDLLTKAQAKRRDKVAQVLAEFKAGKLKSSSGKQVEDRQQALAIALAEKRRAVGLAKYGVGNTHGDWASLSKHGTHNQKLHGIWAKGLAAFLDRKDKWRPGREIPAYDPLSSVRATPGKYPVRAVQLADQIAQNLAELEPDATDAITKLAAKHNASMYKLGFRLKSHDSLARKIESDSIADGVSFEDAAKNIGDAVRYTFTFDTKSYTKGTERIIADMEKQGYKFLKIKNYWDRGDSYNGINAKVLHPSGKFLMEVQFHTNESAGSVVANHPAYEEARAKGTGKTLRFRLHDRMTRTSDRARVPSGVSRIGTRTWQAFEGLVRDPSGAYVPLGRMVGKAAAVRYFRDEDNGNLFRLVIDYDKKELGEQRWANGKWVETPYKILDFLILGEPSGLVEVPADSVQL